MCCLFGMVDYGNVWNPREKTKILSVLSQECEVRGTDATGISYNSKGQMNVLKRPVPAHKFHFRIPKDTQVVMGHTRLTTQGNEKFNYNNHPFFGECQQGIFSVSHNGVLHNEEQLKHTERLPPTHIQTDSYVIVQLLEKYGTLNFDSLKKTAEKLEGSFTFTVLDKENNLYIVKGDNPLCCYHFNGHYIYASTKEILRCALGRLGMLDYPHSEIPISCGDILKIDAKGRTTLAHFDTSYFERWNYQQYFTYHPYATVLDDMDYEEELLEYGKHLGLTREDVHLLLQSGYDFYGIEELLYYPSLLESCLEECREALYIN